MSMVTISIEEYAELQESKDFLEALRAAGVDNWEGYDIAREIFTETKEEE
jgi:hypothetical protein